MDFEEDFESEEYEGFKNPEDRALMLSRIKSVFGNSSKKRVIKNEIPNDILERPLSDLMDDEKIAAAIRETGVTINDVIKAGSPKNIKALEKFGSIAEMEINRRIKKLKMLNENFFDDDSPDSDLIKKLESHYGFKRVWLSEWAGYSGASISMCLKKNINRGRWRGKKLNENDRNIFSKMNEKNCSCHETQNNRKYLLLKGDNPKNKALIIIANDKVNCWFNTDLSDDFRELIESPQQESPDPDEIMSANATGNVISIMKKKFFCPDDYQGFLELAQKRGLTPSEYSEFIFGFELKRAYPKLITDNKIIKCLEKYKTNDGKIKIKSLNENWLINFAKRNGFESLEDFIRFYGYESAF